jgi:hypothetical protein
MTFASAISGAELVCREFFIVRLATARIPTYNDLSRALELLTDVLKRYELLFEQSMTTDWDVISQGDWQAPFRPSFFPSTSPPGGHLWTDSPDPSQPRMRAPIMRASLAQMGVRHPV